MNSNLPAVIEISHANEVTGYKAIGWWGLLFLLGNEFVFFASLLSAYFYIRVNAIQWPIGGVEPPEITLAAIGTVILLASSVVAYFSQKSIGQNYQGRSVLLLLGAVFLGSVFVAIQVFEYTRTPFLPQENAYTSLFYVITGIHLLHVLIGLLMLVFVALYMGIGFVNSRRTGYLHNAILYWNFAAFVWLFIFSSLYLSVAV